MFKRTLALAALSFLALADVSAQALQDPTRPLGHVTSAKNQHAVIKLNSVLISDLRKVAVINGEQLAEGETIAGSAGVRLKRIMPRSVLLSKEGRQWRVSLENNPVIKKPAKLIP